MAILGPRKAWLPTQCDNRTDKRIDIHVQTSDKVVPMCCYASEATMLFDRNLLDLGRVLHIPYLVNYLILMLRRSLSKNYINTLCTSILFKEENKFSIYLDQPLWYLFGKENTPRMSLLLLQTENRVYMSMIKIRFLKILCTTHIICLMVFFLSWRFDSPYNSFDLMSILTIHDIFFYQRHLNSFTIKLYIYQSFVVSLLHKRFITWHSNNAYIQEQKHKNHII